MPRDTHRKVRFASYLAPPFTDAQDARYAWQREQSRPEEEEKEPLSIFKLCFMLLGVVILFAGGILAVYFIFRGRD